MYYELGSHPTPVRDTGFKCVYIYIHTHTLGTKYGSHYDYL